MPLDGAPDNPASWLGFARADVEIAQGVSAEANPYVRGLGCFHCQQAAEKAFKAVLVSWAVPFPKTHDLSYLAELVKQHLGTLPPVAVEASRLAKYAVDARYPDEAFGVASAELEAAATTAIRVVEWAERMVNEPPLTPTP